MTEINHQFENEVKLLNGSNGHEIILRKNYKILSGFKVDFVDGLEKIEFATADFVLATFDATMASDMEKFILYMYQVPYQHIYVRFYYNAEWLKKQIVFKVDRVVSIKKSIGEEHVEIYDEQNDTYHVGLIVKPEYTTEKTEYIIVSKPNFSYVGSDEVVENIPKTRVRQKKSNTEYYTNEIIYSGGSVISRVV